MGTRWSNKKRRNAGEWERGWRQGREGGKCAEDASTAMPRKWMEAEGMKKMRWMERYEWYDYPQHASGQVKRILAIPGLVVCWPSTSTLASLVPASAGQLAFFWPSCARKWAVSSDTPPPKPLTPSGRPIYIPLLGWLWLRFFNLPGRLPLFICVSLWRVFPHSAMDSVLSSSFAALAIHLFNAATPSPWDWKGRLPPHVWDRIIIRVN